MDHSGTAGFMLDTGTATSAQATTLLDELQALDPQLRWRAAAGLAAVHSVAAAEALGAAIHDAEPFVRWSAAQALGELARRAIDPAVCAAVSKLLLDAAESVDPGTRTAAADAIAACGAQGPLEPLLILAQDAEPTVRASAVRALGLAGSRAAQVTLPSLLQALADCDPEVRRMAANALAWCRDTTAVSALWDALPDEVGMVRAAILRALARLCPVQGAERMLPLLGDPDPAVRVEAIRFLSLRGGGEALPMLAVLESDPAPIGQSTVGALAADARLHVARRLGFWHELRLRWQKQEQRARH
jgi:HEAT repeat protein